MTQEITLDDVMRYPAVTAHPLFQTYHSIDAGDGMVDFARNTFELTLIKGIGVQGNVTVPFVRKVAPDGTVIDARRVETFDPAKYDVVFLYDSGTSLMIGGRAHDYHSVNPRLSWAILAEIPNFVVPRPDGQPLKGGGAAGAFVPQEQEPGGGGLTEEQMRAIIRDELGLRDGENDLIGQFAGNAPQGQSTIRKGLHETGVGDTKTAMRAMIDKANTETIAQEYQYLLGQFIKDRVYEVLLENGVIPSPPEPTP